MARGGDIQEHPEYPHVIWDLEPDQKGKLPVAKGRGGPFNIAYEVHGHGPIKIVWVMGLGSLKANWQRQTKDFGHTQADKYSCLIFDNRGMGDSDKPRIRYSTSEMARDAIELLDHVGWTESRSVHVVGISMGGMIGQELGLLIPDRIASLNLISTAPYIFNTVGYVENLRHRINLIIPKSIDQQLSNVKKNCYTLKWLAEPDECEYVKEPFPTNGDRFAAMEVMKRNHPEWFTRVGFLLQLIAAGWHHKTPEQLKELGDKIGRERILVVHGTIDGMISFPHGEKLLEYLGGEESGITKRFIEGQSHVMPIERRKEFNSWIEAMVEKTEKLNKA
ncbi:alpha/beta-hydrolase [Rhizodiscina lignyota]|uniref:Alpha/beta-hydrolase n=1 Tax=Rhizodiscina lignyota TaxID=1504668 RepID=A0A9P4IKE6_9PEZI|nr:alpha/beta-hydrolase [Rhizodiscina lignyota]